MIRTIVATRPRRQQGATLVIALVLLLTLSMLGVWAFNSSSTNTRIVGNMQARQEALSAAQAAVEQTISSPLFITNPTAVAATPVTVNINGTAYAVLLKDKQSMRKPACYRLKAIKQNDLDANSAGDRNCMKDAGQTTGIESEVPPAEITSGDSMCSNSDWNIYAEVTDPQSGAFVAVNQGIAQPVVTLDAENACPI